MIFPRFHQLDSVRKVVEAARGIMEAVVAAIVPNGHLMVRLAAAAALAALRMPPAPRRTSAIRPEAIKPPAVRRIAIIPAVTSDMVPQTYRTPAITGMSSCWSTLGLRPLPVRWQPLTTKANPSVTQLPEPEPRHHLAPQTFRPDLPLTRRRVPSQALRQPQAPTIQQSPQRIHPAPGAPP